MLVQKARAAEPGAELEGPEAIAAPRVAAERCTGVEIDEHQSVQNPDHVECCGAPSVGKTWAGVRSPALQPLRLTHGRICGRNRV